MSMTRNEFLQEAAIRAMQGMIISNPTLKMNEAPILARFAVAHASALTNEFPTIGEFYELQPSTQDGNHE